MIKYFLRYHFEWSILLLGLLLMGFMNPWIDNGTSFCLFELMSVGFCPGEGLGHSIAFTFHGHIGEALQAHPAGPAAVGILSGRIMYLWKRAYLTLKNKQEESPYG